MSTHDSIIRYGQGRAWRARWRRARRSLRAGVSWGRGRARPVRAGRLERRRLRAIECALVAETPQLASMFAMFAQLTVGENHDGAERLPRVVRSRPRRGPSPRRAYLALLFAFASLVALCVTLSFRVHPSSRNCPAAASSAASGSPAAPPAPVFRAGMGAAYTPVHMPGCRAYPTYSR
jgi:hypothetical protein